MTRAFFAAVLIGFATRIAFAIIIVRPVGNTTAIVSGKGNTTGNALVDAYILPP